jgi:hypothetical protein
MHNRSVHYYRSVFNSVISMFFVVGLLVVSSLAQGIGGKAGIGGKGGIGGSAPAGSPAPAYSAYGGCDSGGGACTATISITSGHLVLAAVNSTTGTYTSFVVSDSNSDTFTCGTQITDAAGGRQAQLCFTVAGAALTTLTLTVTGQTGGDLFLDVFDYTNPAALLVGTILDQLMPGAQNENATTFTTGTSSATTNATDLCFGYFWTTSGTWTPQGGYTSRGGPFTRNTLAEDLTTSTTGTQAATATIVASYGPGVGACFK